MISNTRVEENFNFKVVGMGRRWSRISSWSGCFKFDPSMRKKFTRGRRSLRGGPRGLTYVNVIQIMVLVGAKRRGVNKISISAGFRCASVRVIAIWTICLCRGALDAIARGNGRDK